jgi:uncharacterized protein YjbI with pentapeptide repeats
MASERPAWRQKNLHLFITTGIIVTCMGVCVVVFVGYWLNWTWTGFDATVGPNVLQYQPTKTLWDWMQLLIVPFVLAIGAFLFNFTTSQNEQKIALQRDQTEHEVALDNQRETLLQAYLDRMSELLLLHHLRHSDPHSEVRYIARARTLTVLPRLDASRKGSLIKFLYESSLIDVVNLSGANLSRAYLSEARLNRANLNEANLSGVILNLADLSEANLSGANLSEADLSLSNLSDANLSGAILRMANLRDAILNRVNLNWADLSEARLTSADMSEASLHNTNLNKAHMEKVILRKAALRRANLSEAHLREADLHQADLTEADLRGASFYGANLREANLQGASFSPEQIEQAIKQEND